MINIADSLKEKFSEGSVSKQLIIRFEEMANRPSIPDITNDNLIEESFEYHEKLCSTQNLKLGVCEASYIVFKIFERNEDFKDRIINVSMQVEGETYELPIGRFVIQNIKKTVKGDFVIREITAYDEITKLDNNGGEWLQKFLYGVNCYPNEIMGFGNFDFGRQIYSAYYSLAEYIGLESDRTDDLEEVIASGENIWNVTTLTDNIWEMFPGDSSENRFCRPTASAYYNFDSKYNAYSLQGKFRTVTDNYKDRYIEATNDKYVLLNTTFCVEQYNENTLVTTCVVDSGGRFMKHPSATRFRVVVNGSHCDSSGIGGYFPDYFVTHSITGIKSKVNVEDLVNGYMPLPYYTFAFRKPDLTHIIDTNSNETARNIMRSILEMTSSMLKMDRYGIPKFFYVKEGGLFPDNILYPSDSLFPASSGSVITSKDEYIDCTAEDYYIKNFSRVQVVVDSYDKNKEAVRWEYVEDVSSDSAYVIEDNIFLCNENLMYDEDLTSQFVVDILQNMLDKINSLVYVPCEINAIGKPYYECGDRISIETSEGAFETIIFNRDLTGINALFDTYRSSGDEYTPVIKKYL